MATRFYLTGVNADFTPPAWQGAWDVLCTVDSANNLIEPDKTLISHSDTSASNTLQIPNPIVTKRVVNLRGVSRKLLPQTISGTVDMVARVRENNSNGNFYTRLHLYVLNKTSGTVLGTLLNKYEESAATGATEWPTTSTGKALRVPQTLTPVTIPDDANDYRIVMELGYISLAAAGTEGAFILGDLRIGTRGNNYDLLPDLTVGATTNGCGFLEFSANITLGPYYAPNLSPETATVISALPFSVTTTPIDVEEKRWYKYVPTVDHVISMHAYNPAVNDANMDLLSSNTGPPPLTYLASLLLRQPLQWPLNAGRTYFFLTYNSAGGTPSTITLDIHKGPTDPVQPGDLLIPTDDATRVNPYDPTTVGHYPATWYTPTGEVRHSSSKLIATELGVSLGDGQFGLVDQVNKKLHIYSAAPNITEVTRVPIPSSEIHSMGTDFNSFYIATQETSGSSPISLKKVSKTGVVDATTWTLPGLNIGYNFSGNGCFGVSRDGKIIYYGTFVKGEGLLRYNLETNSAMSTFAPPTPPSGEAYIVGDVLVLRDGNIVVTFYKANPYGNVVVHYSPTGTILRELSYSRGPDPLTGVHHISYNSNDDPDIIWVWETIGEGDVTDGSGVGKHKVSQVRLSTGETLGFWENGWWSGGSGAVSGIAIDESLMFGAPDCCPMTTMMVPTNGGGNGGGNGGDGDGNGGVVLGSGGIYQMVPNKRTDTLYTGEFKIPDPFIKTGLL